MIENLTLPKARVVQGNPATAYTKTNMVSKQPELDAQGNPKKVWRCCLAIPKADFMSQVYPRLQQEVALTHPHLANLAPEQMMGQRYSFKIIDGDSPMCPQDSKVPYNQREGYAGCYVVKLSTEAFAPGVVVFRNGKYENIGELEIKTGDYVLASVQIKSHSQSDGGLYWNPNAFCLVEYGNAISTGSGGIDPTTAFGAQGVEVVGNPMAGVPVQQTTPVAQVQPAMQTTPVAQVQPAMQTTPVAQVQPAHDFVQQAMGNAPVGYAATMPTTTTAPQAAGSAMPAAPVNNGMFPAR